MSFACQVSIHLMQGKLQRPLQISDICVALTFLNLKAFKFNVRNLKREYTKLELYNLLSEFHLILVNHFDMLIFQELFVMYLTKLAQRHGDNDQRVDYKDLAAVVQRKVNKP